MKYLFSLFLAFVALTGAAQNKTSLSGTVVDDLNGEPLAGAGIYFADIKMGTTTDINGNYVINNLPRVSSMVRVSYIGHQTINEIIDLNVVTKMDFRMKEMDAKLNEVVVTGLTGNTLIKFTPSPISVVSSTSLEQSTSTNIIDALAKQPGISQITTGGGISKPVIRGLGYNRVAVVNNEIRQEGQQWGDEHGVEIDQNSVNEVQILKGPASLIYGSDALAGVIVMKSAPALPDSTINIGFNSEYQTNNGLFNYSLNIEGNNKGFVWGGRFSSKMAHDYSNKYDGKVFNSRFSEKAADAMLGFNRHWGHSHLHFSYYNITPGIVEGERDDATGKFIMPFNNGGVEDEKIYEESNSYRKAVPYQQVYHYKVVSDNTLYIGNGKLKANFGFQRNIRREFEDVINPDECELDFNLNTFSYNVHYLADDLLGWKTATGINGMFQSSRNKGDEFLVPDYNAIDLGIFATAYRQLGDKWSANIGLRFDNRHVHGKELIEEGITRFEDFEKNFSGLTGSIGMCYVLNDKANFKFNLSRGFRAPNISELASNGVHEGTVRYEVGNVNLRPEKSLQFDFGAEYSSRWISVQSALFANWIDNYIFLHKHADEFGNEIIRDDVPEFGFHQSDAWIYGAEIMVDIHPWEQLHIENAFSFVNAVKSDSPYDERYLPFTPAPEWDFNVRYDFIRHGKLFNNLFIQLETETCFRQNHFFKAYDTETSTPSYTLLNCSLGTNIKLKGVPAFSILFAANNITDCAYQNHLSRLKYADTNLITGRRGVYNMGRNFIIKFRIPLSFKIH